MTKVIFFLFIFLSLIKPAIADSNVVGLADTAHINTHTLNGSSNGGTPSDSYDENFSSGYGSNNSRGDGGLELHVISENIFSRPVTLNRISYRLSASCGANGKYTRTHNFYMYVEYKAGGEWYQLPGSYQTGGGGEGDAGYDTGQVNYSTSISDVKGLRAVIYSYGLATGGEGRAYAHGWVYELQGWGAIDIGLRAYDGTGIVRIACEPAGVLTSPLRINKYGTTYAIVLVEPASVRASRLRIITSSGLKALARLN